MSVSAETLEATSRYFTLYANISIRHNEYQNYYSQHNNHDADNDVESIDSQMNSMDDDNDDDCVIV